MQGFQASSLKKYFDKEGLLFPIETIVEKSLARDFNFFLNQPSFLKVVDTLEQFQDGALDPDSKFAWDFFVFKRELYQMWQINHRSA
mmetsp:Transcript_8810/g.6549  ORF Transcript_8810/g.6549 Transcript_8810/m.6549 type:complete len:87 (+) Transcript_8810:114-374(+)